MSLAPLLENDRSSETAAIVVSAGAPNVHTIAEPLLQVEVAVGPPGG